MIPQIKNSIYVREIILPPYDMHAVHAADFYSFPRLMDNTPHGDNKEHPVHPHKKAGYLVFPAVLKANMETGPLNLLQRSTNPDPLLFSALMKPIFENPDSEQVGINLPIHDKIHGKGFVINPQMTWAHEEMHKPSREGGGNMQACLYPNTCIVQNFPW